MVNRIGTVYPCGSKKEFSSRFCVDSQICHGTPEEGRRTYQPKSCYYNYKDEDDSPNILSNNNQTNKQKARKLMIIHVFLIKRSYRHICVKKRLELMQYKKKMKEKLLTAASNSNINIKTDSKTTQSRKKNRKINNCTDSSNHEFGRLHITWICLRKRKPQERN